jgi:23S rRNA (guanine745-N1)-methyltransferase
VLTDVIEFLICPVCGARLAMSDGVVRCGRDHSYDVARQGYVNLMRGTPKGSSLGDTAAMVDAREEFLGRGHFEPLAQYLSEETARMMHSAPRGCVVDVGAGTGYYLAKILDAAPGRFGVAFDASRYAARRAARAHSRIGAVVCDAWRQLPVRDGAAAVAVNVFAPRNSEELHRILSAGGRLILATPSENHLEQLVTSLDLVTVDEFKEQRLEEKLRSHFILDGRMRLDFGMTLPHDDVEALVGMGPSAWHMEGDEIRRRITSLPEPVEVRAAVSISVYEPR